MRTKIQGLSHRNVAPQLVEGVYHARVVRFETAGHSAKPCRAATFRILAPSPYEGRHIRTRLYCHSRALWKLHWFLSDFGYDSDLLADEVLDDHRVVGLEGVIRLAYWGSDGQRRLDVQGFAPAARWEELSRPEAPVAVGPAEAGS